MVIAMTESEDHPLRRWRLAQGVSIRQLEILTGINRGRLSQYERGLRVKPEDMAKIAEALERGTAA